MVSLQDGRLTRGAYQRAVEGTTGSFFSLPIQGSALLAGCSEGDARLIGDSFLPVGHMFQVQDDILDLYGDKCREKRGSYIRDGKVSALVVEHIARCPWDAEWLLPLLKRRGRSTDADVDRAIVAFRQSGALNACLECIDQTSRTLLTSSPMSEHRWLPALASEFIALVLTPLRDL